MQQAGTLTNTRFRVTSLWRLGVFTLALGLMAEPPAAAAWDVKIRDGAISPQVAEDVTIAIAQAHHCPRAFENYVIKIGSTMCLFGEISAETREMVSHLRKDVDVLMLDSPGGNLLSGIGIGEIAKEEGWIVFVPSDAQCWSACVNVLAGGAIRAADVFSRVGVHMVVFDDGKGTRYADPEATMASLSGINPDLAQTFRKKVEAQLPKGQSFFEIRSSGLYDWTVSEEDLMQYGIADLIISTRQIFR